MCNTPAMHCLKRCKCVCVCVWHFLSSVSRPNLYKISFWKGSTYFFNISLMSQLNALLVNSPPCWSGHPDAAPVTWMALEHRVVEMTLSNDPVWMILILKRRLCRNTQGKLQHLLCLQHSSVIITLKFLNEATAHYYSKKTLLDILWS